MVALIITTQQLIAAIIDGLRIKYRMGAVGNIHHAVSVVVALILACAGLGILHWPQLGLTGRKWLHLVLYATLVTGSRLILYDPLLNLMRREKLTYVSSQTSAITGAWWRKFKLGFWGIRLLGIVITTIAVTIIFFFKTKT